MSNPDLTRISSMQIQLDLRIEREIEVDGVGMGVLNDSTPYLTLRGLARMCGVDESSVRGIVAAWAGTPPPPRVARIKAALKEQGFKWTSPYVAIVKDGSTHYACPDMVCMAFLEYYAFDAKPASQQAVKNYRLLARKTLRDFIYARVGYHKTSTELVWQQFHDRIDLNYDNVPDGYFSIFKDTASVQLALIREGVMLGVKFIPDLSVGNLWGKHWRSNELDKKFGARLEYNHYYPESYPQAKSNPQGACCYPDSALAYFKQWLRNVYLMEGLPKYLSSKTKDGSLSAPVATAALSAIRNGASIAPPTRRLGRH